MEDSIQRALGERTQEASDGTNPFTSSELRAIIKRNNNIELEKAPSSHDTNPLTTSELKAIVKSRQQANSPSDKEPPSDATNPFTSSELKVVIKRHEKYAQSKKKTTNKRRAASKSGSLDRDQANKHGFHVSDGAKRSLETSHDNTLSDATGGDTQADLDTTCRQSIIRVNLRLNTKGVINIGTQSIGMSERHVLHTTRELVLTQSQHDIGINLQIAILCWDREGPHRKRSSKTLRLDLLFDPNSDSLLLINNTILAGQQMIVIRQLPASSGDTETAIGCLGQAALIAASYGIYVSDQNILDITVLPRRYISLKSESGKRVEKSAKRSLEPSSSQSSLSAAKRAKVKETNDISNNVTIIRALPTPNELVPIRASSATDDSNLSFVSGVCHSLEELQLGKTVKIANATKEDDYTLIRRADLSVQKNSLVFKAHHSSIPGELIVVKIWRSKSDFDLNAREGLNLSTVGGHWLNVLKNHLKVSQHPAIASLYSFDARLLALYLEHVDAPNLQFYRESGSNPHCTLDDSDAERVLHDIADALQFVHGRGIVHNDIKPANILYSKDRGPVLIDFGWSSNGSVHSAGSPWYIPPEYPKYGKRGPAGDIFAFGVVMLFLLRRLPLPELRSPPLKWLIHDLRKTGPEATKAIDTMTAWLGIITTTSKKLQSAIEDENAEMIFLVIKMLNFDAEQRITGYDIMKELNNEI